MLRYIRRTKTGTMSFVYFMLCFFVFVFNYSSTKFIGITASTWTKLIILSFIIFSFATILYNGGLLIWSKLIGYYLLFVLFSVFSLASAFCFEDTFIRVKTMILLFLLLISVYQYLIDLNCINAFLKAYVFAAMLAAIYLILVSDLSNRIGDAVSDANQIGISLTFASTIAIHFLKKERKIIYLLGIVVMFIAILLTGSRTAFLLIVAAIICYTLLSAYQRHWPVWRVVLVISVALILIILGIYAVFNYEPLYNILGIRLLSFYQIMHGQQSVYFESSTQTRMLYIRRAFEWFLDSPIVGHGLGSFPAYNVTQPLGEYCFSHCDYVEILSGMGIFGIVFFVPFLKFIRCGFIRGVFEESQSSRILLLVLAVEFLISEVFLVMHYEKEIWFLIPLLIALYESVSNTDSSVVE